LVQHTIQIPSFAKLVTHASEQNTLYFSTAGEVQLIQIPVLYFKKEEETVTSPEDSAPAPCAELDPNLSPEGKNLPEMIDILVNIHFFH
jgi:hypothetical protein